MVSSYTANLAACLTVDEPHIVLKGVETLRECAKSEDGCPVKFGAKSHGSTLAFFKVCEDHCGKPVKELLKNDFMHHQNHEPEMYEYMIRHELLVEDNKEGLEKVLDKQHNYAFLMESSTILYHTERICNLTRVGELIDDKNYAIGMRKSNFRTFTSPFITRIQSFADDSKCCRLRTLRRT